MRSGVLAPSLPRMYLNRTSSNAIRIVLKPLTGEHVYFNKNEVARPDECLIHGYKVLFHERPHLSLSTAHIDFTKEITSIHSTRNHPQAQTASPKSLNSTLFLYFKSPRDHFTYTNPGRSTVRRIFTTFK